MHKKLPETLVHIENRWFLLMSKDELLDSFIPFKENLRNGKMNLSDLFGWRQMYAPMRMLHELGVDELTKGSYYDAVHFFDQMLVSWPMNYETCVKLLEVFYTLNEVELFNAEAIYAKWVLESQRITDPEILARYLKDWEKVCKMGKQLDSSKKLYHAPLPEIGSIKQNINDVVGFYFRLNGLIESVASEQAPQKSSEDKSKSGDRSGSDKGLFRSGVVPPTIEGQAEARLNNADEQVAAGAARQSAVPSAESSGGQVVREEYRGLLKDSPRMAAMQQATETVSQGEGAQLEAGNAETQIHICDRTAFMARFNAEAEKDNKSQLASLEGLTKPKKLQVVRPEAFEEIERIGQEQPNFAKVTEQIIETLHAQCLSGMPANLPPLLLHGGPGVGKTRYVKRIAKALGLLFCDIPMAGNPDAFKISGLSRYWGTAGPGMIARTMADSDMANPIFLMDEIDKVKRSDNGDPLARILLLLERETAEAFKDDFVDVSVDISFATYLATANDIRELPEPLLNRFICINIEPLDNAGRYTLVRNVYCELREQEKYGAFLHEELSGEMVSALAECELLNGRELKRELQQAMQRACRQILLGGKPEKQVALTLDCLRLPDSRRIRSIGFM